MPRLLVQLDAVTRNDSAPIVPRALFPLIMSYLLIEEDLLPPAKGAVLSLMDDAYLVHRAAGEIASAVPSAGIHVLPAHVNALRRVMPADLTAKLDKLLEDTISTTITRAEALRGTLGAAS